VIDVMLTAPALYSKINGFPVTDASLNLTLTTPLPPDIQYDTYRYWMHVLKIRLVAEKKKKKFYFA